DALETTTSDVPTTTCHPRSSCGAPTISQSDSEPDSAPTSQAIYVGRCPSGAWNRPSGVLTPLNTSSQSLPASPAPPIAGSNRSPTTNGRCQPAEVAASNSEAACGLPATVGCTPVDVHNTAAIAPLPGNSPRSLGSVASVLHTNHHAPSRTATHASASSRQPVSGSCPCTTAATPCAACRTGRRPTSPTIPARASVPSTSTFAAGANRCASNCAAAYELVYTSCVS